MPYAVEIKKPIFKTTLLIFLIFCLFGCNPEEQEIMYPPPLPEEKPSPTDYVFLIDNSGSIPRGESQEFARDAIKAFIELSEIDDKISIITFDDGARIIASEVISGTASRVTLINSLKSGLDFRGQYTDIGAGLHLLRQNRQRLIRQNISTKPLIILISDGMLEPRTNRQRNYQTLLEDFENLAQNSKFYTLGLGDTDIHREFLPEITGNILLNALARKSGGEFFAIQNINDLMDACINLLQISKGYGELKGREVFLTDESTSRLMLLIIKRLPNQQLYQSRNINILDVRGHRINLNNFNKYENNDVLIHWNQGYYYDLIIINRPNPGRWTVTIENDMQPRVIAFIKNQIHLRYQIKSEYYEQEEKVIMAWLYDERSGQLSNKPYKLEARLDSIKDLQLTKNILTLDSNENLSFLALMTLNKENPPVGQYYLQLEATDTSDFFIRKSPLVPIKVEEAYFRFEPPDMVIRKWPIFWKGMTFSTILDTTHIEYPDFESPPQISLVIDKIENNNIITRLGLFNLDWQFENNKLLYFFHRENLDKGSYLIYFQLSGILYTGQKIQVRSMDFYFSISWPIWVWIILALMGLVILYLLAFLFRPKLKRRLELINPPGASIRLNGHKLTQKSIKGDRLRFGGPGNEMSNLINNSFLLIAKRNKRVFIKILSGNITLIRNEQTRTIQRQTELLRNDILSFTDNNVNYKIKVICPRIKH